MALTRMMRDLGSRTFLLLVLLAIVATRMFLILDTPTRDGAIDLSIYRETGELVVHGVDPYDYASRAPLRERLRQNDYGAIAWVKEDRDRYNYYVSSNAPGTVVLFGLIQLVTGGNATLWRVAFALGDVAIALCAFFFLGRAGVNLEDWRNRLTFAGVVVAYPSLLLWGTLLPEDKQFQTASMLLLGGLLLAPASSRGARWSAFATGVVAAFSIAFKVLGAILIPVAVMFYRGRPWREAAIAILAFAATGLALFMVFDASFVTLILQRAATGSSPVLDRALHGSPWGLFPSSLGVTYVRPALCVALAAVVLVRFLRGRIDLLNSLAAIHVVFICLWITGGSMDRMNIAMLFALMCVATLSVERWRTLCLVNLIIQVPIYAGSFRETLPRNFQSLDGVATIAFLLSYFCFLLLRSGWTAGHEGSWPREASAARSAPVPG
jgi:hypothetical protein